MPWWNRKSSVSTSSSSSSPSSVASSPGTVAAAGRSRSRDIHFPWTRRSSTHRHFARQLPDIEVSGLSFDFAAATASGGRPVSEESTPVSRSPSNVDPYAGRSSSSPVLIPHPLPLPELVAAAASPNRESSSSALGFPSPNSVGRPLPSPKDPTSKSEGDEGNHSVAESSPAAEPIGERTSSVGVPGRLTSQSSRRSPEGSDISSNGSTSRHNTQMFRHQSSAGAVNFRLNIPAKSAPTSGFSSPVRSPLSSPRRLSNVDFLPFALSTPGVHGWSAPDIASADVVSVFSPHSPPEKNGGSPDLSPRYSPTTKNPFLRSKNPSASSSPLHSVMFPENSATWHENGGNISVHPLPLPPGAASPSHSGFSHQNVVKAEPLSMTNQWQKGKLIGSGTFGNVYEATNRETGALCAMKEVNIIPDDAKSIECIKQLEQEVRFLSQFKHPNIVQYYGSDIIDDRFYIYLEYVHPGSINKYVHQHIGAMTESVVRNFTRHILKGLAFLHSKNIMHRDIKGANLLVDVHGVVKLADFGMAKHLNGAAGALSLRGSPYWMAPEVVQATMNKDVGYDLAVDIWSLGCTIIEMLTGKHPWSGLEGAAAMFKVLHKDPPIPESLSNEGKDFLRSCFRRNPAERPTADALLEHPFIRHSQHYNMHGSLQAFAGIKIVDNSVSPSDKTKSRSESSVRVKHSSNGECSRSHHETSEISLHSAHRCASESGISTRVEILSSRDDAFAMYISVDSRIPVDSFLQPQAIVCKEIDGTNGKETATDFPYLIMKVDSATRLGNSGVDK
ncbi:mitogen-activated protein kinase kinase kinase YODA-like isoform X2 [Canna indica]|uniref:mitogen-activated protein kinase kinase kinase n=1 Tax=Canna indica TaxID=4628 RepID=A0AAQ3Q5U6_9LILI|nr:mitogen-activated protein kinase kinase kinase YODA-like isoform X2 [Canna indica]